MYVCVCNAVTERHIVSAVAEGARRLKDLRNILQVTKGCGRCASCARQCLKSNLANCSHHTTNHVPSSQIHQELL